MNKLMAVLMFLFAFNIYANDKIAYVQQQLATSGTYELCEAANEEMSAQENLFYSMGLVIQVSARSGMSVMPSNLREDDSADKKAAYHTETALSCITLENLQ